MSNQHQTLSSTAQRLRSKDYDPASAHRFASGSDQLLEDLQDIVNTTSQMSQSLDTFISLTSFTNPKLVSQLKQHSSVSSSLHTLEQQTQSVLTGLNAERLSLTRFGEDIPRDRTSLPSWCISRIESYGAAVGLQPYTDEDASGKISLVLAGQVMVLDIVLKKGERLEAVSVSTSYASQGDQASVSPLLDSLILGLVQSFLNVVYGDADPWETARLAEVITAQFRDLVLLDSLANQQTGGGGCKWFTHTGTVDEIASRLAQSEAQTVSSSLTASQAPLDVFLLRSHALPLPFLSSVFMSFLVHLSPQAYLQLKRSSVSEGPWDIPTSSMKNFLSTHPRPPGTVCAELRLVKRAPDATVDLPMGSARPFLSQDAPTDHTFPIAEGYAWTLNFTGNGGARNGVVMCQSRMKEIEMIVHESGLDVLPGMSFGSTSWVDLLLGSRSHFDHYTCEYTSPSSAHPPLHLRLTNATEPGFTLERVPVRTMKDVWAVLEIVREQCWLNETLLCCSWAPETSDAFSPVVAQGGDQPSNEDLEATEDELQAILSGTLTPKKIPVNVTLSSGSTLDSSLTSGPPIAPKITMSFSMPSQSTSYVNMVNIPVVFKPTQASGIEVDMGMMIGPQTDSFGEVCRRGGCFSLPGRVWVGLRQ